MALNSKVNSCSVSSNLTESQKARLKEVAATYNTGDATNDYIAATSDILASLEDTYETVVQIYNQEVARIVEEQQAAQRSLEATAEQEAARRRLQQEMALTPEEAWADMLPDNVLRNYPYNALPDAAKAEWTKLVLAGKATQEQAKRIQVAYYAETAEKKEKNLTAEVNEALEIVSDPLTNTLDFLDAIGLVVQMAFFNTDSNNRKNGLIATAQEFFKDTTFTSEQLQIIDEEFLSQVNSLGVLEAYSKVSKTPNEWFLFAGKRSLLPYISPNVKVTGLPLEVAEALASTGTLKASQLSETVVRKFSAETKEKLGIRVYKEGTTAKVDVPKPTMADISNTPEDIIAREFDTIISNNSYITGLGVQYKKTGSTVEEYFGDLFRRVDNPLYTYRGKPLKNYFTDGKPNLLRRPVTGTYIPVPYKVTPELQARYEQLQKEEAAARKAAEEKEEALRITAPVDEKKAEVVEEKDNLAREFDRQDGNYKRDDGTPITSRVPVLRIRSLISSFLKGLRFKPNVHVYANVADLKARNPELYKQAAAARAEKGDFDTTEAMGYSFGTAPRVLEQPIAVSRRQFLQGVGAVAAAATGKLNLAGLSNTELWQEAFRLNATFGKKTDALQKNIWEMYDKLFPYVPGGQNGDAPGKSALIELAYKVAKGPEYSERIGDRLGSSSSLAAWLDSPSFGEFITVEDDGWEMWNFYHPITEAQVSEYRDAVEKALAKSEAVYKQAMDLVKSLEGKAPKKAEGKAAAAEVSPTVIIFSDYIRTEKQLKFVLAHETLGHFGLRSIFTPEELRTVLSRIYQSDRNLQSVVDAMVEVHGMDYLEATEEYISDQAAILDSSLLLRLWNKIKDALNKLGVKFADDEARYIINLARKYPRTGNTGSFLSGERIVKDMVNLEAASDTGRFMSVARMSGNLASRVISGVANSRRYGGTGGYLGGIKAFQDRVFGVRRDVPGTIARILEEVQTLDNKARRSDGLTRIYNMLESQQRFARSLLSKYQDMTKTAHAPDYGFFGKLANVTNITDDEKQQAGELLAYGAAYRREQLTDEVFRGFGPLASIDPITGSIVVNNGTLQALKAAGRVTAEQFRRGIPIKYSTGETVTFRMDVKEDSNVWKIYNEMREAVDESAIDLMLANFESAQSQNRTAVEKLNDNRTAVNVFSKEDLDTIKLAAARYESIYAAGSSEGTSGISYNKDASKRAEQFVIKFGRALFNEDVYAAWMRDPNADPEIVAELQQFRGAGFDDIVQRLPALKAKITGSNEQKKDQSFEIQRAMRDRFMFEAMAKKAELNARRTIGGGYVPFVRRGTEQLRITAYDKNNKPVVLSEDVRGALPYMQFESRSEALDAAEKIQAELEGTWTLTDENNREVAVTLRPEVSRARQTADLADSIDYSQFIYTLNKLNVNLLPETRERIITVLTGQGNRARQGLERTVTPGWDQDVVRGTSEYLETTAHVAAKKLYKHRVDDILLNNDFWLGSEELLNHYKAEVDNAPTEAARARAKVEYDKYAYMYRYMAPTAEGKTVEIAGKKVPTLGRGEDGREDAKRLLSFYSDTTNLTDSTEDMLSGETGSALKLATVVMQLGGSVATAVINMGSLATHSMPYLSFYNPKTGVGGGYGSAKAAAALSSALRSVKNPSMSEVDFFDKVLRDNTFSNYGLTRAEAEFLREQTAEGVTQAAQFNALVGTARGKAFANKASVQAAIKVWMSMFSYTEQLNRRTTALAAYRLEKERALAQGMSESEASKVATDAARTAVNTSQGEYAMFNRPEMARGNIFQYIFMYKQFVVISVQLLRAMPLEGRLLMLGLLLMVSGIKGLPFAEDLMDLFDTLLQKLGIKQASVEKALSEWIDTVAPGMTPVVMRGVVDLVTSTTVSTRMGMGDILPLSGAFRAGASPIRELENFAGPMVSAMTGLVQFGAGLTRYGAETIGLRDDTTSFNSLLRDSPVALFRSVGDSLAYMTDGRISNTKGQVISNDVSALTTLTRLMGFYPAIATQQNDIVRLSKYTGEYAKVIKAEYVGAYVKAKLAGDTGRMQEVIADVREWNEGAEGTGLEIPSFVTSAERAAREAARPTVSRYLKSAPKDVRPETQKLLEIYGIPLEELEGS